MPDDARLLKSTGNAARMCGQATRAVELYIRTLAAGRPDREVDSSLVAALVQLGRIDEAHLHAEDWLRALPGDINAMAFVALLEVEVGNDQAARQWFDFDRFVRVERISPPASYEDLEAFNRELEDTVPGDGELDLGAGSSTTSALRDLGLMLREAVDRYLTGMADDDQHPFLKQRPVEYDIVVRLELQDEAGQEVPRVHASGYLSGCYFVTVCAETADAVSAGSLGLGRPSMDLPFKAQFPVKTVTPGEGLLLLFPAFMYRGTASCTPPVRQMCIAFDVVPSNRTLAAA